MKKRRRPRLYSALLHLSWKGSGAENAGVTVTPPQQRKIMAIRALEEWKPKARRVMVLILPLRPRS